MPYDSGCPSPDRLITAACAWKRVRSLEPINWKVLAEAEYELVQAVKEYNMEST